MSTVFIPLMLLLGAFSCEAAFDKGAVDTVPVTVSLADSTGAPVSSDKPLVCSQADIEAGGCYSLSWDRSDFLSFTFTVPKDVPIAGGLTPEKMRVSVCYAPVSQVDRPWRKSKDEFDNKKDKRCLLKTDFVPFATGETVLPLKIKSDTPSALFSARLFIRCEGQGDNEFCHTSDLMQKEKMFFKTEAMDSRPTELFVGALISAALGPLMLAFYVLKDKIMGSKDV